MEQIRRPPQSSLDVARPSMSISTKSSCCDSLGLVSSGQQSPPPTPVDCASLYGPPVSTREQICLCQPEPKIPRPRNAFILYRQQHQAHVIAQNPGLPNPEISRIIGQQWGEQPEVVKEEWKQLAEEEKQRHQLRYPNYKCQPRRPGKPNPTRLTNPSNSEVPGRCSKCGGRYTLTPRTQLTSSVPKKFSPFTKIRTEPLPSLSVVTSTTAMERSRDQPHSSWIETPRPALPLGSAQRQNQYHHPPRAIQDTNEEIDAISLNERQKRRRLNGNTMGGCLPSPIAYHPTGYIRDGVSATSAELHGSPLTPSISRRFASIGLLQPHSPGILQSPRGHQFPLSPSTVANESVRLPPIKTTSLRDNIIPNQASGSQETRNQSIEALVMTIPFFNKIKVLRTISGPLASPRVLSPAQEIRGVVIAVESADQDLLGEVGTFLSDFLNKEQSCSLKVWSTSFRSREESIATYTLAGTAVSNVHEEKSVNVDADYPSNNPFVDYFSIITQWHQYSQDITKYITTDPASAPAAPSATNLEISSKTIPIALIPNGFSLTTSDTYAVRTPINDSYSPMDHWQWMATLWRGIVGPDLTIYVKRATREEFQKCGCVEIHGGCNTIVVRALVGGQMDERTMRRLGFEVVEFVRGSEGGIES